MNIFKIIKSLFASKVPAPSDASEAFDVERFIYVKIPGNIQPIDRGELFEDRIEPELARLGLGSVSGGGSSLGIEKPDGTREIEFCGLDIDVTDRERALSLLRDLLPELDVPTGTELHYTRHGQRLQDEFADGRWTVALPRSFLHPGFDI